MYMRVLTVAIAALVWAVPAAGQQRGTMEFGAFASAGSFDNDLSLKTGYGAGGRLGMYLHPRWSIEFEDGEMRASRPNGLRDVNVGILSGRLVSVPIKSGALSFLLGAGAGLSTETNFMHTYGLDALVGAKVALHNNVALRVDGVWDWLANENWKSYKTVRIGLAVYRHPSHKTRIVTVTTAAGTIPHSDSVSAEETRRLREREAALLALRDSLSRAHAIAAATSAATSATMQAEIHFEFDNSELDDAARALLDDKVAVFRANPDMTISIMGHADLFGTDAYNMALGSRRAQAASAYIVSRGVDASRVIIDSKGESQPVTEAPGIAGQAPNRRANFRLLIAPNLIRKP